MFVGITQELTVTDQIDQGFLLGDGEEEALLPNSKIPEGLKLGDTVDAFIVLNKEGRLVATTEPPLVELGGFAHLEVVDVSPHGAHMDWGYERDLLVPYNLMHVKLQVGQKAVVTVFLDDHDRVIGASKLSRHFDRDLYKLKRYQPVDLLVYDFSALGALVVVNQQFAGLVYKNEIYQPLKVGDKLQGWVKEIRHDGKVDITLQRHREEGIKDAKVALIQHLQDNDGFLPLTDKSDPKKIKKLVNLSKKAFKRAVGGLYKERALAIEDDGIRLLQTPSGPTKKRTQPTGKRTKGAPPRR